MNWALRVRDPLGFRAVSDVSAKWQPAGYEVRFDGGSAMIAHFEGHIMASMAADGRRGAAFVRQRLRRVAAPRREGVGTFRPRLSGVAFSPAERVRRRQAHFDGSRRAV